YRWRTCILSLPCKKRSFCLRRNGQSDNEQLFLCRYIPANPVQVTLGSYKQIPSRDRGRSNRVLVEFNLTHNFELAGRLNNRDLAFLADETDLITHHQGCRAKLLAQTLSPQFFPSGCIQANAKPFVWR